MSRKKVLTQDEIDAILFHDTDESDLEEEDDGWNESRMMENEGNFDSSFIDDSLNGTADNEDMEVEWSEIVENENIELKEFNHFAGPVHNLPVGSTPLDYLKLFLTDDVLDSVRRNTNKYAEFCARKRGSIDREWRPIETIRELWTYFTVLLVMSINHVPRISDYWSEDPSLGNERIKRLMTRNRFVKIKHYFHVSDRDSEKSKEHEDFSYTQKLEPFMSDLKKKFTNHFEPSQRLSVDEALIKFKGRLGIVQYMPLKPDKRGIKVWMLCTSQLGYTLNFDVYSGRNSKVKRSGKGLGYDVVLHLTECLNKTGHHLYFDRFFTSVGLMIDLHKKGLESCGTVMPNRVKMPAGIKNLKLKESYESKAYQCTKQKNLLCTAWLDKRQILMLSTNAKNEVCKVNRRKGAEKLAVPSPVCFANYNKNMGGVDLADQRRKYYTMSRKSSKWWKYLFSFLFDTAINNAYIIYLTSNYPRPKQTPQLYDFKLKIIGQLATETISSRKRVIASPENVSHDHKRQKISGRKRTCVVCRQSGKRTPSGGRVESSWECSSCKMCLCKDCFI